MARHAEKTFFRTTQHFKVESAPSTITQYVSERTGMHVVVVDLKGPKIQGYFTLATEIFDDSGSPHTLEHLVFMGSKSYHYKGLLDKLASRAYSSTNAWTATDHTAYTLDTAGWEGFAQILPVYLEHVLLPTITDEACLTEVHHIDGDGKDAGVVYSEMQGVQNTGSSIMDTRARQLLYPKNVGFRYETGGLMENLRVLTPDRIRAFHKEMYQPKNFCLVLVGEVDQAHMLQILDDFEESILGHIPPPDAPFKRPFIESAQPPALQKSIIETIHFPEEDESMGEILVGFFGPDCNDPIQSAALSVLLTYLAESSISVLENAMVEKEHLASSVMQWWDARPHSVIWLQPTGVATERLAAVEKRLFELLKDTASKPLDMSYMLDCIRRERRMIKFQSEESGPYYSSNIITDFVFGNRDGSTLRNLGGLDEYDALEKWSDLDWRAFLRKWISDAPHVSLLGTPSKELAESTKAAEEARIAKRIEELGPKGLEEKKKLLEAAVAKNDVEIPASLLQKWPVPGVDSIHFIETITARSGLAKKIGIPSNHIQKIIDHSVSDVPLFLQFEHVPTNFVHITLLLGTSQVATELKPLLPLLMDLFFTSPIMREGKRIEFEAVVTELEKDTVSYYVDGGARFSDAEGLVIQFQVEPDKYAAAIEWVRVMMFDSIVDVDRLSAGVAKLLAEIPDAKREGDRMAYGIDAMIHMDSSSAIKARSTLVRAVYMKRLKKLLAKDPKFVVSKVESLYTSLFKFENMRALVAANVGKLPEPVKSWQTLMPNLDTSPSLLLPIVKASERLTPDGRSPGSYGCAIVPIPAIDSSFLVASAKGPNSYDDPVLPVLMVAMSFLEAVEGPLWTAVRGTGLAYGANFNRDVDSGFVQFSVYRSPDAYRAFAAAKKVLESYIDGTLKFEVPALEGAISGIVVALADAQTTMATAGQFHFINGVVKGLDEQYDHRLLKLVRAVTVEEMQAVMKEVLLPAFLPGMANVAITCAPIMEEDLVKGFTELGFKTHVENLASFKEDYGLEGDDDEEEEDDEDEEVDEDSEGGVDEDGEDD